MAYIDDRSSWFEGQGLWQHVPAEQWQDWTWQLKNRLTTGEDLSRYMTLTPEEKRGVAFAGRKLAMAITPYFFNLIDRNDPNCPIRKQLIPREGEMFVAAEEQLDSLGEDEHSPVPGVVHRYPDRVLFLVTDRCAAYCRYCTRSRLVSNAQDYNFHPEYEQGLRYIESHPEVRDVLLSGGDPLLLSDRKLEHLLARLREIPHVEFIRIGSRIPVFLPQRITPKLCEVFKRYGPIWMSIHVNHPKEATAELRDACERLGKTDVHLSSQTLDLFARYWWPGNVRQLRNEIQRAVAMSPPGGTIDPDQLSADLTAPAQGSSRELAQATAPTRSMQPGNLAAAVEEIERSMIGVTLERTRGNISETARVLGLTRRGLYLKMRRLGLDAVAAHI